MEPLGIALVGCGTVGGGVARLLLEHPERLAHRAGRPLVLRRVVVRHLDKPRSVGLPRDLLTTDLDEVIRDPSIQVAAELVGGVDWARQAVLRLLAAGKDVVTANKQLLSHHGEELYETAREHDVRLRFEAAVGGVVPVVRTLEESLAATPIERIHGIVNGTTNYILTEMSRGASYAEALADAQQSGYAEADPSDDVTGRDAAAKMAILARLAFGTPVHLEEVRFEGIENIQSDDLQYAQELDLGLKLVGTAERRQGGLSVSVYPTFLYPGHPLAAISGSFNAVTVESETITEITLSGPGAGGRQTASAVLGDVVSVMTGGARPPAPPLALPLIEDVESAFYLHLDVQDRPGVLATVTQVLGEQQVSIKSVVQRGMGERARLVMVTHPVLESALRAAVEQLGAFDFIRSAPRTIRVIEEEFL